MTHKERRARRKQMAEDFKTGMQISDVAQGHGVTTATVRRGLEEWGIAWNPRGRQPAARWWKIVAALVNGGITQKAIALEHRVSTQYVNQMAMKCREYGLMKAKGRLKGGHACTGQA